MDRVAQHDRIAARRGRTGVTLFGCRTVTPVIPIAGYGA